VSRGDVLVSVDARYYRPTEVETLLGDPSKAREKLGWQIKTPFDELVRQMVGSDVMEALRDTVCERNGFDVRASCEEAM
jgi:GDPmannose 4,6-dehydratase